MTLRIAENAIEWLFFIAALGAIIWLLIKIIFPVLEFLLIVLFLGFLYEIFKHLRIRSRQKRDRFEQM